MEDEDKISKTIEDIRWKMTKLESKLKKMDQNINKKMKKTSKKDRKYPHTYVETVSTVTYLRGKLSVLEDFSKVNEINKPAKKSDIDYIG